MRGLIRLVIVKVSGRRKEHKILLYSLSSCVWCKMTKKFLKDNEFEYKYIDVDLCQIEEVRRIKQEIIKRVGQIMYPTIIVDEKTTISRFQEDKLREILEIQ
jgi:glutaredoxin